MNRCIILGVVVISTFLMTSSASAQFRPSSRSIRNSTRNYLYNRPSVSPYVNLTGRDASIGLPNYYTRVRPALQQREQQMQQQRRTQEIQRDIAAVQSQLRQSQQQQAASLITGRVGWSARGLPRFGSTLNYYPGMRFVGGRRR